VPRAPLPVTSVTRNRVASSTTSKGITPSSSPLQAHAPNQLPPPDFVVHTYFQRSLQVAASTPAGNRFFPDVISANLSSDAWPSTPTVPPSALACFCPSVVGLP